MSLQNKNNELMSAMFSRATSISFDPLIQHQRAQFNPSTGSWVFGLAAFAAGVALKKMIQPASEGSPAQPPATPTPTPDPQTRFSRDRSGDSMKALLRDTMAEEGRSGDFLSSISSEVAKLREEVATLSAQKEQLKAHPVPHEYDRSNDEYSQVKETLGQLNAEKARLARTEAELQQVLMSQKASTPGADDAIRGDLLKVQDDLQKLKHDQERIQSEYELSQKRVSETRSAMDSLKLMFDEKVASLKEAESREENLKREHQILLETVANLKKQLDFFREQATQDKSGVTSLKILEESNSRLSAQVDTSLLEAEQQQAALKRLTAEKSELAKQLDEYQVQARESEMRMHSLESALSDAKSAEQALLARVEELSSRNVEADGARIERLRLENELAEARVSIQALEDNENMLNSKLEMLSSQGMVLSHNNEALLKVTAERDGLQQDLFELEKRSGDTKNELEEAAVKEEELNLKIDNLLNQIKNLENERDLHKSRSDMSELQMSKSGNEFDALKQSIQILEGEKSSLSAELQAYQREAAEATRKHKEAEQLILDSESKERKYRNEIESIRSQLLAIENSKLEFATQQKELQKAEAEIQHLLANRQNNEHELANVNAELNHVKRELDALNTQQNQLAKEEQLSSGKVAQIEEQLRERDHIIADSKLKEDNLRSEVAVLQQTTHQLHGELERLREVQSALGSSNATLNVLQETEQQLNSQLRNAQGQIEQQHQNLLKAEQERARLEAGLDEESAKFANLNNENNFLRQQLAGWEAKEAEHSNRLLQLNAGSSDTEKLEQELMQLRSQQLNLKSHLDSTVNEKGQLEQNLNMLNGKLQHVVSDRDHLSRELENVSVSLGAITAERDDLQNTCSKLQLSIQELVAEQNKKDQEHKQALLAMEMQSIPEEVVTKELASEEQAVVKLELPQDESTDLKPIGQLPEKKNEGTHTSQAEFVRDDLDTSVFEPSVMNVEEFESPVSENLFESTKVGRLRKFKGHRKIEDIESKEKDLEERVKAYKDRLEQGESEDQIALSIAKAKSATGGAAEIDTKHKAYSPNRSFMDLLEDSERRKVEQKPVNIETSWSEVEELEEEDIVLEEGTNYKPLLFGGAAAGLAIGAAAMVLFNQSNNSSDPSKRNPITDNQQQTPNSNGSSATGPNYGGDNIDGDVNLSSIELKDQALDLLKKFHNSADQNVKASLCRVPKRTLADMKDYYSNRAQDYAVTDVEISPHLVFESKMKFIKAEVKTQLDGETGSKVAYFVKDDNGDLKLDWYNYVGYEVTPWDKYLNLGDVGAQDWHVSIDLNGNEHPDFPEDQFVALKVRSWSPDAINSASAYLSKENVMYQQLMDAYKLGQKTFILRLRHLGDITNSLYVDEVISLSEFYVRDIDTDVSSSIDEISFGDSSY
ncbi:MAG: hypothetical protein ACSHX6_00330 [Akkermansiaceae bacterium]